MMKGNRIGMLPAASGMLAEILFALFLGLLGCGAFALAMLMAR